MIKEKQNTNQLLQGILAMLLLLFAFAFSSNNSQNFNEKQSPCIEKTSHATGRTAITPDNHFSFDGLHPEGFANLKSNKTQQTFVLIESKRLFIVAIKSSAKKYLSNKPVLTDAVILPIRNIRNSFPDFIS